jgi:DNA-binding NarL/FixJ family response regulator
VRFVLEEDVDVRVVGEAGDAATGVEKIAELQPDVVLLDLSLPGLDGLEAIPRIHDVAPSSGIVVFSGFAADRMREPTLSLGADQYLEKGASLETVRSTLLEVGRRHRGG